MGNRNATDFHGFTQIATHDKQSAYIMITGVYDINRHPAKEPNHGEFATTNDFGTRDVRPET